MKSSKTLSAAALALTLVVSACGGDDDDAGSGDQTITSNGGTSDADGAITSIDDVEPATVRIVAKGTFAEPSEAEGIASFQEVTGVGSGSGFIISADGIAVTNNHVVTGAASLEVYVGDNKTDAVSAKVLGVSECNDLAVIDLEGDGYPFVAWNDDELRAGLDIRAAGFPLGDEEFTLTSGIVSKAESDGDTSWASIDATLEHDANIQPGNSGGPLLSADDATVIGVVYAASDPGTGTNQFFAIPSALAQDVVKELARGNDVLSLGVNGQAIFDEESGVVGVWVASVASGSPAGEAGLEPGDIIEKIEGLPVATDGTMKDYCDILRSHDAADTLTVQVLRFADGVRLQGEFNGDELVATESLFEDVQEETGGALPEGTAYEYTTVSDDTGVLVVEVPTAWSQLQTEQVAIDDSGTQLPQIIAAPSVQGFLDTFDTPGMSFLVDPTGATTVDDVLAASNFSSSCTSDGAAPYEDPLYTGQIQYWTACGGTDAALVVVAAQPPGGEFTVRVVVQVVSEADADALDRIIQSFRVVTE